MISVSGLGSGLDVEGLVSQLVAAERQAPELRLNQQESIAQARLSAFAQIKGALSTFQSSIGSLDDPATYQAMTTSSSDSSILGVSGNSSAVEGSYDIEVSQLAARHSLASGSFADSDTTEVGTGTLTIRLGTTDYEAGTDTYNSFTLNPDREVLSLTIDSSNNTLEGISEAINEADAGVRAAVVNDGSGYRLLLSSDFTGAENSLEVAVTDGDGNDLDNSGLSRLSFNSGATHLDQTAAAADAALTINGLAISSADNSVDSALDGVTLDLKQISTGPVQVDVSRDLAKVEIAVGNFVARYNELRDTLTALAGYDADAGQGALLQGDFTVNAIENRITAVLRGEAEGVQGDLTRLSQLGITTQSDGKLAIEGTALSDALENDLESVIALFSAYGQPSDADVSYLSSDDNTQVGNYAINVTQLASAGVLNGAGVLPDFAGGGTLLIDDDNDAFSITVDGVDAGSISISQGLYSDGDALAAEIMARINSAQALQDSGLAVTVAYSAAGNNFSLTSDALGSDSTVEITAVDTNSAAELGFSVATGTAGQDVAGTIGGEAATGVGQVLSAPEGAVAAGLSLLIAGSGTGDRGTVNFSRGLFNSLNAVLDDFLVSDGLLDNRSDGLQDRIEDIGEQRLALDRRMEAFEVRYRSQFGALDLLLTQLQGTSEYLTTQLANLPKPGALTDS